MNSHWLAYNLCKCANCTNFSFVIFCLFLLLMFAAWLFCLGFDSIRLRFVFSFVFAVICISIDCVLTFSMNETCKYEEKLCFIKSCEYPIFNKQPTQSGEYNFQKWYIFYFKYGLISHRNVIHAKASDAFTHVYQLKLTRNEYVHMERKPISR